MNPIHNDLDLQEEDIEKFANMIHSTHNSVQFEGLIGLRRLISVDDNPPIQKVFDSGIVPKLLEMMACEDDSQFQIESSWCVTNLCSGEGKFVDFIIELGGIDILINLLGSKNDEVVLHAIFSIRNISGTGSKHRDICLRKDCMNRLLHLFDKGVIPLNILNHTVFAISNLCAGEPSPPREEVLPALPMLQNQISSRYSEIALEKALWAIASISQENIQEVIDEYCVPFLVNYLSETNPQIVAPSLKALGNLLIGTHRQTDEVLKEKNFLPSLFELTTNNRVTFRKEAFWAISNIAAGSSEQIQMILENDNYILRLKTAVKTEIDDAAKEAGFAICNMISEADSGQIDNIVKKHGLMESFAHILTDFTSDLKKEALEAVLTILRTGDCDGSETDYRKYVKEAGMVEIIKNLAQDCAFDENANLILEYLSTRDNDETAGNKRENEDNQDESNQEV